MERGIHRQEIFKEDIDYQLFLLTLRKVAEKYNTKIHAYCLMTNHIHLLLETGDNNICKIMHLFEDRYKSCIVKDDAYFLQTSRYIHLNPVKAHMVAHPEDYIWSSYRTILGMTDDRMTERDRTLNYFKSPETKRYRDFVEDIGHKYIVTETEIHRQIEEDEEWLPW